MSGIDEVLAAYRAHGIEEQALLESHAAGTDCSREVCAVELSVGSLFVVFVRDGGVPGMHAAPEDANPGALGIVMDRRHKERFLVMSPLKVLRCHAADFETGHVPGVGGCGGGVQYILPPDWRVHVRRVQG